MTDPIAQTRGLAESHGLEFKDCGNGHVQIKGHGALVNYYPLSRKQTAFNATTGRREANCTPWDAVKLCMNAAAGDLKPPKRPSKNGPDFDPAPVRTETWVRHFYAGSVPPWDESLGEFQMAPSYRLRVAAKRLMDEAETVDFRMGMSS